MVTQCFENLQTEKNEIDQNQPEPNIATGASEEPKINQNFEESKILNDDEEFLENPDIKADPEDTGNVSYFCLYNSAHAEPVEIICVI